MEHFFERALYRSRWFLAPIYFGLSLAVVALGIKFFQEVFHLLVSVWSMQEANMVLIILSLIDIAMVGGLLVMVMMSGYENFVSELNVGEGEEKLGWLGTMDSASLKAKIAATIVAISSIHLLKKFMEIDVIFDSVAREIANDKLTWYVVMHLTFVGSAFLMGYLDTKTKH
ncbi:MAG: hypothetical protein RL497_3024 [Pseudomonadota bacterium]|jgi:uncharacterized protein (TIGR00645 family)